MKNGKDMCSSQSYLATDIHTDINTKNVIIKYDDTIRSEQVENFS